ncbi:LysR family transcriptional regulator [Paraglaciecola aquimarina]|uniref:LysR family transcriptional regulator n=1 Tax=Paraglaciecola algarum TaxID=3050085 RepID=A0ABS9D8B8_9ALTE|nr:LysR family transcriptional regulator [Paraglaciecola sp. G1-23]MCF2948632.1 LysR family transcriptional regulator [Paraglaciecola sp. G1-23]
MNSKQLQYFLATVENGSITAAARAIDVAQPAISLQLANLEHELKLKLFERDFRGVHLTDAGKKFEYHANIILTQINQAKADLVGNEHECSGKVVVGLSQSICNVLSVDLLTELEHRFANIEIDFRIGPSNVINNCFAENELDIILGYELDEQLENAADTLALIRENLYLYISQKPQNPAYYELTLYGSMPFVDLQHYETFAPNKEDALYKLLNKQAKQAGIKLKTKSAFGQLMTTLHYVMQGVGLIVAPSSSAFHLEKQNLVRAIDIVDPPIQRDVYLSMAEDKKHNAAVKVVYELIRELTANVHDNKDWRGELLDQKYAHPSRNNIEALVAS